MFFRFILRANHGRAIASYLSAHKIGLMSVDMGVAVPPSVPGARVDGGLDSRFRENDDL